MIQYCSQQQETKTRARYEYALWFVNACVCVLHATSATVVLVLWSDWPIPVQTSFINWELKNTTSDLGCGEGNCYVKADFIKWDAEISILGLVLFFHVCSFAWQFAVLWPGPIQQHYHASLAKGYNSFRWVEYSISAPAMLVVIAAVLGQIDVVIYFLLAVCTSLLMGLGYLQEIHMRETIVPHVMGWVLFVFTWVAPTFTFAVSLIRGSNPPPERVLLFIWLTYFLMITLFGCFGIVQIVHVSFFYELNPSSTFVWFTLRRQHGKKNDDDGENVNYDQIDAKSCSLQGIDVNAASRHSYYLIEYAYGILSATSKVTLAVMLILLIRARNDAVKLEFGHVQNLGLNSTAELMH